MSYTIRLLPSGHAYTVEPQENLLEAALRNGINLRYSCASGTCGECKARLVSGQLGPTEFHDYVISEAEKGQGYTLLCRASAASDLVLEANEILDSRDVPHQRLSARVAKLERLDEHFLLLYLRTPRTQTLNFLAGQHVQIGLKDEVPRDLSIASCPCNGLMLQFHLEYVPGDPFSEQVFHHLHVADPVEVEGPYGRVTLDEDSLRPLVLIAQGTGFAAIKSLLEHAIALEMDQPVHLLWVVRPGGHYLLNYCRAWENALDAFRFETLELDEMASDEEVAALARAMLERVAGVEDCDVYAASGCRLCQALETAFVAAGGRRERLFFLQRRG